MSSPSGPRSPKLKFFLFDNVTREFIEIFDGFVCGRGEGDLRFPDDDLMSRRQCRFHVAGSDVYVEDLGSTNKTQVNGVPIRPSVKRRLHLNDVIEFGLQRMVLSHQDKFAPANIRDHIRTGKVYKAARIEGDVLTSDVSEPQTDTLLKLDRAEFRKLKFDEAFRRVSGRPDAGAASDSLLAAPSRGRAAWIVAALLALALGSGTLAWMLAARG